MARQQTNNSDKYIGWRPYLSSNLYVCDTHYIMSAKFGCSSLFLYKLEKQAGAPGWLEL